MKDEKLLQKLGVRIVQLRNARDWSKVKLAVETGLGETHLCDIEAGRKDIAFSTLIQLARGLQVDPAELVRGL